MPVCGGNDGAWDVGAIGLGNSCIYPHGLLKQLLQETEGQQRHGGSKKLGCLWGLMILAQLLL